jgi:hypothetical protein
MAMTDLIPDLGAGAGTGAVSGPTDWREEMRAEMKMMFQGVSKAISGLRAELVASQKGKEKVSFEETADVEAAGVEVLEMMSSMPGDDSFLSEDSSLPKPSFTVSSASMTSGSSDATAAKAAETTSSAAVVAAVSTYPSAWSTYMTPAEKMNKSMLVKIPGFVHSPVRPIPVFTGAEGEDVHLWISKAKLCSAQSGWNETTLLAQTMAALEGAASAWLHTAPPEVKFQFVWFEEELQQSFSPFTQVELLKDYGACCQEKGEQVRPYYFRLLLLRDWAGLLDKDFLVSCFCKGLWLDILKGVEMLPNSTTLDKLLECVGEYESRLWVSITKACNIAAVMCKGDRRTSALEPE